MQLKALSSVSCKHNLDYFLYYHMSCDSFSFPFIQGLHVSVIPFGNPMFLNLYILFSCSNKNFLCFLFSFPPKAVSTAGRFMCPTFMCQISLLYSPYHHCYLHPGISLLSACWELVPFPVQMHYEASVIWFYFVLLNCNPKSLALSTTAHIFITQSFLLL